MSHNCIGLKYKQKCLCTFNPNLDQIHPNLDQIPWYFSLYLVQNSFNKSCFMKKKL